MKVLRPFVNYFAIMASVYVPLALCYGFNPQQWTHGSHFVFLTVTLVIGGLSTIGLNEIKSK